MKIISWNLLHTKGATLQQVHDLIGQHRPDLFLMQEASEALSSLPKLAGGYFTHVTLPGRHHGLAAWSVAPLHSPVRTLRLQRGLIVKRVCQILEVAGFTVANVHLSHGQVLNRRQLRRIAEALPEHAAIIGDCNLIGSPLLYGFKDAGPRLPTHDSGAIIPLRLDRCFIRGLNCESSAALARGASDHRPIIVELSMR